MSVSLLVSLYVTNFSGRACSKTRVNIKTKFHTYFWSIEIKSWLDFGAYRPKIKGEGGVKIQNDNFFKLKKQGKWNIL